MKTAYELAMERLNRTAPAGKLTATQKKQLAEIDQRYQAKRAEREIFLNQQIAAARATGPAEELEKLTEQLRRERTRIDEEREDEKNKVRRGR